MVELGQALFGNKYETHVFDYSEDVGTLMEWVINLSPDNWETEYINNVFEIRPYYWGDCTCGYEASEWEWSESHNHTDNCYQTEYKEITRNLGYSDPRATTRIQQLCDKYGFTYPNGSAIHCSCTHQTEWVEWATTHDHTPVCPVVLPNFYHKHSGLKVYWYKHIGRSTTANMTITFQEWQDIYDSCRISLREQTI